jgi:hypothetical protein
MDIKDILLRYKTRFKAPESTVITSVVEAYREVGIVSNAAHFTYHPHTRTLSIVALGPQKSELLLRKDEMRKCLEKKLATRDMPVTIL